MQSPASINGFPAEKRLIDLESALPRDWMKAAWSGFRPLHEPFLKFEETNRAYERLLEFSKKPGTFFEHGLQTMDVTYEVTDEDRERIPTDGPLITVSNHPFGGIDGVVLGHLLTQVRGDVRIMANHLLGQIEPIKPWLIEVDPFGGEGAVKSNLAPMRQALKWMRGGGCLELFPSGTVSHLHARKRQVTDPQWVPNLGGLIRRSKATVIPVYFEGCNSSLFQALGLIHPRLRTVLLARELMNIRGRCLRLRVGNPISAGRLAKFQSDESMMGFLRLKTYILQNRELQARTSFRFNFRRRPTPHVEPIAPAVEQSLIDDDLRALPEEQALIEQGEFSVYYARAKQIPNILQEIGRLRELTFREVEEGTGLPIDLDQFDRNYIHLFLWNRDAREIVGAYRIGATDEILEKDGSRGLYTTTLFKFKPGVLRGLNPALELGRSFIIPKYQRRYACLSLIWRGIGAYVARNPRYKTLFGPVSISKEYQSLSKNLIMTYLKEHSFDPILANKVKAKKPPRSRYFGRLDRNSFNSSVKDIEDVSALISEIEDKTKGVPVLLRQYLKFSATMLSFNVDPEFNDCIDGLVLVDLSKTNERILRQYMGDEGLKAFYAYHEVRLSETVEISSGES